MIVLKNMMPDSVKCYEDFLEMLKILFCKMPDKAEFSGHYKVRRPGWLVGLDGVVDVHDFDKVRRIFL